MELLQRHFDTALESPDGIKKLRQLILTLAMQGKLVKQDNDGQTATELLLKIEESVNDLHSKKKIKKKKNIVVLNQLKYPYNIPNNWCWVELDSIINPEREISYGIIKLEKEPKSGGIPTIRCSDVKPRYLDLSSIRSVEPAIENKYQRTRLRGGEVLLNIRGTLGGVALVPKELTGFNIAREVAMLDFQSAIDGMFAVNLISSPYFWSMIENNLKGIAYKGLNLSTLRKIPFPLPPFAEQKRIVARIDELMVLCNNLEKQRYVRNDKRLAVHTPAINCLLTATDKNDFDSTWQFITRNFDPLYSAKENVADLKKAILTLAMQGRLVKQDTNDQPASELLKEIQAEKEKLIAEYKIKSQKESLPISPNELPYALPNGWIWTRLGEVGNIFNGNSINENEKDLKYRGAIGLPYIGTKDVGYGFDKVDYANGVYIPNEDIKFKKARKGAVLICSEGGSAGKKCGISEMEICFGNKLFAFESYGEKVLPNIILAYYLTSVFAEQFNKKMTGIIGGVSINKFQEILLPLCSLAEQKRIVAKIDELMALCDKLEKQIDQATTMQTALFDAVLAKV